MAYRPPVAVYDACVLYPFHLRNVLVQCAVDRLVTARWTDDIHDEWIRNLIAVSPILTTERLWRTRDLMKAVLPDADVRDHHGLIERVHLPDPDDRHVVAAALAGGATTIATWNTKDFPDGALAGHGLSRIDPDAFLSGIFVSAPEAVAASVENARRNLRRSAPSLDAFLTILERQGLKDFVGRLRRR